MKVEFEWKSFGTNKPTVNTPIIFKISTELYFGEYKGFNTPNYCFKGGKLRLKSLSKKNTQDFCIYDFDCENIQWDYYNSEWV